MYDRWATDDAYYNGSAGRGSTAALAQGDGSNMFEKWAASDDYYNSISKRETDRMLIRWTNPDFGDNAYEEARFWAVFKTHSYPSLQSKWQWAIGQEEKKKAGASSLDPKRRTNFTGTIEFLSPVTPRLGLSLTEAALLQHIHLNLSRAGYHHLYHDKNSSFVDPHTGDLVRGYPDPAYVLSRRAKAFYSGTPTDKIPGFHTLDTSFILYKTLAPRRKHCAALDAACPMCRKKFHEHSTVVLLPCSHLLHKDCAADWFVVVKDSCPVCEYSYRHLKHSVHSCKIKDWRV